MEAEQIHNYLDFCCEAGRHMIRNGAEMYRVEESVTMILLAYGFDTPEVFAIPASILLSIEQDGINYTKSVRIRSSGNNLDKLDKLNALCRYVCQETPDIQDAMGWLRAIITEPNYPTWVSYTGYGCVAVFFTLLFGGNLLDAVVAGICGMALKTVIGILTAKNINFFFTNMLSCMILVLIPMMFRSFGLNVQIDRVVIGAIMLLVPGLAITNVMRDVIVGDFLTAVSKLAEVLIVAVALAIGISFAYGAIAYLFGVV